MNNTCVKFTNNKIDIYPNDNHVYENVQRLWSKIREDYKDTIAQVRLKPLENGKSVAENLKWHGMSTWWLNPLVGKDTELRNRWLNRLMVLYLCNELPYYVEIETDDQTLISCIKKSLNI